MILSYLLQNIDDSDKKWYIVSCINLLQKTANALHLTWIVSLQCESKKVALPKTFCYIFTPGEPV